MTTPAQMTKLERVTIEVIYQGENRLAAVPEEMTASQLVTYLYALIHKEKDMTAFVISARLKKGHV